MLRKELELTELAIKGAVGEKSAKDSKLHYFALCREWSAMIVKAQILRGTPEWDMVMELHRGTNFSETRAVLMDSKILFSYTYHITEKKITKETGNRSRRFFRFVELSSYLLPAKTRMESFEPAYNDAKADYLKARKRHKKLLARAWLTSCFSLHVGLMLVQCVWGMCSGRVKRMILGLIPGMFR